MPACDAWLSIREQVASLHVRPCRLAHEQVIVEDGQAKRRSRGIGIQPALLRVGLCPAEHRARQLSCAHTTARYTLENAILALHDRGAIRDSEFHALQAALSHISETIHQTDWSNGEAETRYALMQERVAEGGPSVLEVPEGKRQIAELVERHQRCVEQLRQMRDQILQLLDEHSIGPPEPSLLL